MNQNIFPNASGVNFINSSISVNVFTEDLKKRLKPSKIADHKHHLEGKNLRRTVCTPGTRVRILNDITAWAYDTVPDSPTLCWVLGPAGFGKTTIAYTIAQRLETNLEPNRRKVVGGNFFCSRQFTETKLASRILPTIVYHLALECKAFAEALDRCGKFDAVDHDIKSQLETLLVRPWEESKSSRLANPSTPPYHTIVVDALDEIEGTGGFEFLRALLDAFEEHRLTGLKIFGTSRPDPALVDRLESFPDRNLFRLEKVPPNEAEDDIRKYLCTNLPDLRRGLVEKIVDLADGLFIHAATIVKHLGGHKSLEQEELLDDLLSARHSVTPPTSPDFKTHPLDELYRRILYDAFRSCQPSMRERRLRILHTILCTAERTSAAVVAHLVADSSNQVEFYIEIVNDILQRLHSVLYSDGNKVLWHHKSFPDFIFAQARSKDFWCNQSTLHRRLTGSCFRVMKEGLRFNMANIVSSFDLDIDYATLLDKFRRDIPGVLTYSCHHWSHHLSATTSINPDLLVSTLEEFVQLRVLFWIEAMNLLKSRGLCDMMLRTASGWVRKLDAAVASKFSDAASFAVYFGGSPASSSTPHLYISALATSPLCVEHWKAYFPGIPQFTGGSRQVDVGMLMSLKVGNYLHSSVVSRDGRCIVSASANGLVQVWSASTGEELRRLVGHSGWISSVAISNDGTRVVSGSWDGSVRVWNAITGMQLRKLDHLHRVESVAFSTDGSRIVSGSRDKSVRVWNATTGEQLRELVGHQDSITSVAFSTDGTGIVSGSNDRSVRVWNSATGEQKGKLEGHRGLVTSVAFSADGTRISSGSTDRSVRVWNATTGKELRKLEGHDDSVTSVAFLTDSTRIVSGSRDESLRVWNATTGEQLRKLEGHRGLITSVTFSAEGNRIVSGSWDGSLRVWNAMTDEQMRGPDCHSDWVSSVAFATDGARIVSGSRDRSVRVWNATTGEQLRKMDGHQDSVTSVAFSTDGTLVVSGSRDRSVRIWNTTTGKQLRKLEGHHGVVTSVAFSTDGTRIVSGSNDRSVRVWNATTGEQLRKLGGRVQGNWVTSVTFSTDGTRVDSGSDKRSERVWNATTGEQLRRLVGRVQGSLVTSVAFSTDGTRVVSGFDNRLVRVWDTMTGKQLNKLEGHLQRVKSVAFSTDGTLIVSGSRDRTVRVWNAVTGEHLRELVGHQDSITSVAFSTDGTRIVSGSSDRSVRVWNSTSGEQLARIEGHCDSVTSVAFSTDGTCIVSGSNDKSIRVWNSTTGKQLAKLEGFKHGDTVISAASSIDDPPIVPGSRVESLRDNANDLSIRYIRETADAQYTGWLVSPVDSTRLMFVPPEALLPDSSMILSIPPCASVDFTNASLGPRWHTCYCLTSSATSS